MYVPIIFLFIFVPNAFNIRRYHPFIHSTSSLLATAKRFCLIYMLSLFPPKKMLQFTASMSNKNKKTKNLLPFRALWSFVLALFMEGGFNENLRGCAWKLISSNWHIHSTFNNSEMMKEISISLGQNY